MLRQGYRWIWTRKTHIHVIEGINADYLSYKKIHDQLDDGILVLLSSPITSTFESGFTGQCVVVLVVVAVFGLYQLELRNSGFRLGDLVVMDLDPVPVEDVSTIEVQAVDSTIVS